MDSALGSLSSARVAALLEQEDLPHKSTLERYHRSPWTMRSTYVVGRVLCAAVTAVMLAHVVERFIAGHVGTIVAIVATVAIYAPFSDLATSIARRNADVWGLRLAALLRPFEIVFLPLAGPLAFASKALSERMQEPESTDPDIASAEVEYFVDEVERSGVVGAEPAEIIRNVLEFEDRRAKDVMVPRNRVEAVDLRTPLDEVRRLVAESGHSRYPVYEGQLDNVIGLLVAKDVFRAETPHSIEGADGPQSEPRSLADVVRRDVIFVPEQQKLVTLLREMRQKRQHLAVVVDEFGGTSGIVTLEDVIEEIVGDIRDEHDDAEIAPIQELGDGRLLALASLPFEDLSTYLGLEVEEPDPKRTIGSAFEGAVEEGTSVEAWGLKLIVRELANDKIERIEIERPQRLSRPPPEVLESMRPPSQAPSRRQSGTAPKPDTTTSSETETAEVDPAASG
ncbi:MAG: HlyC/CorC family transporter [Polyangiaceae bacterium]|nr:HlyC/CorC family transporter [Polyangiaceae bacterium]